MKHEHASGHLQLSGRLAGVAPASSGCHMPLVIADLSQELATPLSSVWVFEILENRLILKITPILPCLLGSSCIYSYLKCNTREGDTSQSTVVRLQPPPSLSLPRTLSGVVVSEWVKEEELTEVNLGTLTDSQSRSWTK